MKNLAIIWLTAAFIATPILAISSPDCHFSIIVPWDLNDRNKKEVSIDDLPNNIATALKSKEHADWHAVKVWKVKTETGWVYSTTLTRGNDIKRLKFNEEGRTLVSLSDCL